MCKLSGELYSCTYIKRAAFIAGKKKLITVVPDRLSIFTDCFSNPVGIASPSIILDSQMTASSVAPSGGYMFYLAAYGRLNGDRGRGWCAGEAKSNNEWLQVDLGKSIQACGLATQGDNDGNEWVKAFKLSYSFDGATWKTYRDESGKEMVRF